MSTQRQYYEILGLPLHASADDIKQAYRNLAKKWHPDRFVNDVQKQQEAEAKFKEISVAYESLKNNLNNTSQQDNFVDVSSEKFTQRTFAEVFYRKGAEYAEKGLYQEAVKEFSDAIHFDPEFLEAYQYRGFILSKLGFENRAKADFAKAEFLKCGERSTTENNHQKYQETRPQSTISWLKLQANIKYFQHITHLAINKSNQIFAYGSHDGTIQIWNWVSNQIVMTLNSNSFLVYDFLWSKDAQYLLCACSDQKIRRWHTKTQKIEILGNKKSWHSSKVLALALSPDGKTLISGGADKIVKIWQLNSQSDPLMLTGYSTAINSIAISSDSQYFVAGGLEPHLRIRSLKTGKLTRSINNNSKVTSLVFSPDSETLAVGSEDKMLRLWHLKTGQEIWTFRGHSERVSDVVFTPDGQTLISASWDKTIKFWSLATKEELGTLYEHTDKVLSLAISTDGKILISSSADKTIKIWQNKK
jgi:WD40 repeat protein